MSANGDQFDEASKNFAAGSELFVKLWSDLATKMMAAGMATPPGSNPPEAARQFRASMLKAMAESCDEFMRSPQFLDMMKQSMHGAIEYRKQMNDFLARMHHEWQGNSRQDFDQLLAALHRLETRLNDGFDRVSGRLEELDKRTSAVELGGAGKKRSPSRARTRGAKASKEKGRRA
jgi:uncharacterized protein YukE